MMVILTASVLHEFVVAITNILSGSGWIIRGLKKAHLNITKYNPTTIGKYIKLPPAIRNRKQTVLNIKNNDDM